MYGIIASSWKLGKDGLALDVTVPPNTTATVWVPAKNAASVTESGKSVKAARTEAGYAVFEVGSGSYAFRAM
jgi:alpha-L-rhamnosidase